MRKCAICKSPYDPRSSFQKVCHDPKCALAHVRAVRAKEEERARQKADRESRKALREAKERIKTRAQWAKEAQKEFNAWVRERDHGLGCISCGTTANVQFCAGHYRTVGACPELRFEPLNVHLQCNKNCNLEKSGSVVEYRINLVKRIGAEAVSWLEGPHAPKKYTVEELKEIKRHYSAEAKRLRKEREQCASAA